MTFLASQIERFQPSFQLDSVIRWLERGLSLLLLIAGAELILTLVEQQLLETPTTPDKPARLVNRAEQGMSLASFKNTLEANLFNVEVGEFAQNFSQRGPEISQGQLSSRLRLVGAATGGFSYAILHDTQGAGEEVFTLGEEVFGLGAFLDEVYRQGGILKARLRTGDQYIELELSEEFESGAGGSMQPSMNETSSEQPLDNGKKYRSQTKVNQEGNNFYISSSEVDKEMKNFSQLLNQARVSPAFDGNTHIGYKIQSIDEGSLYQKLGLNDNDIIQKVNGEDIDSPDKAFSLLKLLQNEKQITLNLQRNGQAQTLVYHIQ